MIALIVAIFTLIVLFSGIPIAFGLSFVSIALLIAFEGFQMLDVFAETFYAGLNSFVLLSIPMFILMGMAVANSPAGKDLYTALDRWLWRVPGGLVISNIGLDSRLPETVSYRDSVSDVIENVNIERLSNNPVKVKTEDLTNIFRSLCT